MCDGDHCADDACMWSGSIEVFGPIGGILFGVLVAYFGTKMYRQGPVVYLR